MKMNTGRNLALAFTLALLAMPVGTAFAQSKTVTCHGTKPSNPHSVTGSDPEPQGGVVKVILAMLHLA